MTDKAFYTYADLAPLLGLTEKTLRAYVHESKPGQRYAAHPFPERDGKIGKSPIWLAGRLDEILEWSATRPGRGHGGGPRRKKPEAKEPEL